MSRTTLQSTHQQEVVTRDMEIRNLPPSITQNIAQRLEGDDSVLSLMMGNIVKDLENPLTSELRFTSSDIETIRNHAHQLRKSAILIFFEEWSTMGGRHRPRLYHLLELFVKCQLFRAADYVATLIGAPTPERPLVGPSAHIDISLPDDVESLVNGMDYPFGIETANLDRPQGRPEINGPNLNFPPSIEVQASTVHNVSIPFIAPPSSSRIFNGSVPSNLIKFSDKNTKQMSTQPQVAIASEPFIPAISALQTPDGFPVTVNSERNMEQSSNIPAISGLLLNDETRNNSTANPAVLNTMQELSALPAFLNQSAHQPNGTENSAYIPVFSQIFNGKAPQLTSQVSNQTTNSSSAGSTGSDDE